MLSLSVSATNTGVVDSQWSVLQFLYSITDLDPSAVLHPDDRWRWIGAVYRTVEKDSFGESHCLIPCPEKDLRSNWNEKQRTRFHSRNIIKIWCWNWSLEDLLMSKTKISHARRWIRLTFNSDCRQRPSCTLGILGDAHVRPIVTLHRIFDDQFASAIDAACY